MPVEADVLVVGAGPAGSATATHLARRGLDVALLEKSQFPREKVCGDGLTPRATRQLIRLGIDTSTDAGWLHNFGLRIYGGSTTPFELPWPELADFPSYGLVRPARRLRRPAGPQRGRLRREAVRAVQRDGARSSTTPPVGSPA